MDYTKQELEIAMLPKMQAYFREMMGELRNRDNVVVDCGDLKLTGIVIDGLVIGQKRVVYIDGSSANIESSSIKEKLRYLPLPIDPGDTERLAKGEKPRGLFGMLDWKRWQISMSEGGEMLIEERDVEGVAFLCSPMLALLKALAHQWGVEVRKEKG